MLLSPWSHKTPIESTSLKLTGWHLLSEDEEITSFGKSAREIVIIHPQAFVREAIEIEKPHSWKVGEGKIGSLPQFET